MASSTHQSSVKPIPGTFALECKHSPCSHQSCQRHSFPRRLLNLELEHGDHELQPSRIGNPFLVRIPQRLSCAAGFWP